MSETQRGPTTKRVCDGCEFLARAKYNYCRAISDSGFGNLIGAGTTNTPDWCPYLEAERRNGWNRYIGLRSDLLAAQIECHGFGSLYKRLAELIDEYRAEPAQPDRPPETTPDHRWG